MLALLFCIDLLPYRSRVQTSGGSLRSQQFVNNFLSKGFEVKTAIPKDTLLTGMQRHLLDGADFTFFDVGSEAEIVAEAKPDIVVWMWPLVAQIPICPVPGVISVVDLNGFQNIESACSSGQDLRDTTRCLLRRARQADVVVYGSFEQRAYWEGLFQLEFPAEALPTGFVLPYYEEALSTRAYEASPRDFYYVGSFLPWLKPFDGLFVLADEIAGTESRLRVFASTQPMDSTTRQSLKKLSGYKNVVIESPSSREKLYSEIGFRGIGFDILSDSFERRFALPIRTVNYLAHGIPIVYNDYNSLSRDIVNAGAGWATSGDAAALRATIRSVLEEDDQRRAVRSQAATALADRMFACRENWQSFASALRERRQRKQAPRPSVGRHDKLNVLVISDDYDNLLNLRLASPLEALLRKDEIGGYVVIGRDGVRRSSFGRHDDVDLHTVVVQRAPLVPSVAVLEATDGRFTYDIDDNLLSQPSYRPPFPPDLGWKVRTYLAQASTVTVTNAFLARSLAICSGIDVTGKTRIVPNPQLVRSRGISDRPVSSVMFASSDGLPLTESAAKVFSAVGAFCRRHRFGFTYIGPYPDSTIFSKYLGGVPFHKISVKSYFEYMDYVESADSIAIIPLETTGDRQTVEFVKAKSDIKAVEYLGLGRPAIFSDAAPYRYSDLPLSYVVPNEREAWEAALEAAVHQSAAERSDIAADIQDRRWIGGEIRSLWYDYLHQSVLQRPLRLSRVIETFSHSLSSLRFALEPTAFDGEFYLEKNPDVLAIAGAGNVRGAYEHYVDFGRAEGRPASAFDTGRSMQDHLEQTIAVVQGLDGELNAADQAIMRIKRRVEERHAH